mmetsp:Transcript_10301/g.21024  ORF Transcript_10301/g.21024 Transcript_10301/m.21024 type:complete len:237 (-) Transcript_10301:1009-1719(-)
MYKAYPMKAMPTGARRAPDIREAEILASAPGSLFLPPFPTRPPTVDPSISEKAMKMTITLTCSQLRKVLSFAKKVFGSIRVLTMAAALGVSTDAESISSTFLLDFLERGLLIGKHMMWYSLGPSPLDTKRLFSILLTDRFLSSFPSPQCSMVSMTGEVFFHSDGSVFTVSDGFLTGGAPAGALADCGLPSQSWNMAGLACLKYGSLVSAISSKFAGDMPPLPSGKNHHGLFLSLFG